MTFQACDNCWKAKGKKKNRRDSTQCDQDGAEPPTVTGASTPAGPTMNDLTAAPVWAERVRAWRRRRHTRAAETGALLSQSHNIHQHLVSRRPSARWNVEALGVIHDTANAVRPMIHPNRINKSHRFIFYSEVNSLSDLTSQLRLRRTRGSLGVPVGAQHARGGGALC